MDRYEFALEWRKYPLGWRIWNYIHWVGSTIWCGVLLKPGPGERLLLQMMSEQYDEESEIVRRKWAKEYFEKHNE